MKLMDAIIRSRINKAEIKIDEYKKLIVRLNAKGERIYKICNNNMKYHSESFEWQICNK